MSGLLGLDYGSDDSDSDQENSVSLATNTDGTGPVVVVDATKEEAPPSPTSTNSSTERMDDSPWLIGSDGSDSSRALRARLIREELDRMLPAKPTHPCDAALQSRLELYKEKMDAGLVVRINEKIRSSTKDPHLLASLVRKQAIEEDGTNYPPSHFSKEWYSPEEYYDALAARVRAVAMRKEQAKAMPMMVPSMPMPNIQFPQSSTGHTSIVSHVRADGMPSSTKDTSDKKDKKHKRKRASKWDQR